MRLTEAQLQDLERRRAEVRLEMATVTVDYAKWVIADIAEHGVEARIAERWAVGMAVKCQLTSLEAKMWRMSANDGVKRCPGCGWGCPGSDTCDDSTRGRHG